MKHGPTAVLHPLTGGLCSNHCGDRTLEGGGDPVPHSQHGVREVNNRPRPQAWRAVAHSLDVWSKAWPVGEKHLARVSWGS